MILIAGGTGRLGTQVVRLLAARRLLVRVMTRDPARAAHLADDHVEVVPGDVRNPDDVERAVAGTCTIISAVHGFGGAGATSPEAVDREGNLHLIRAAQRRGVGHFVLVSIQGASADHPIDLFRMKHRAEQSLRASGLPWTIVRSTAFMEFWAHMLGGRIVKSRKTVIVGRGRNPINFVSVHDVARFVELAVLDAAMRGLTVEVGGPENLSFDQVVETFERETGRRGGARHVPLSMMRAASLVMRAFNPTLARQIRAGIVMDTADMRFDASARASRFRSIPMTTLAEVVRRDFAGEGQKSRGTSAQTSLQ